MAKSLIITEKPSVAQEFARILGVSGRNDGYIENDKYVITWCVGHLVEMVYPEEYDEKYKRWRLEDLPFLPEEYKYNVIPDVSKQYDTAVSYTHLDVYKRQHLRMILMPCFLRFLGKNIVQYLILIPCCHGLRWMTEHR